MLLCALSLATTANADEGPTAGPSPAPRVAPAARSYPRGFTTYDALIDYAKSVAAAQQESDARLAAPMARQDAAAETLKSVFDPRLHGGLLRSRADLMDDKSLTAMRTELASDTATGTQLVADGATVTPAASWTLPRHGEDTEDSGPTPSFGEPAPASR